jgi:hypothetical protein
MGANDINFVTDNDFGVAVYVANQMVQNVIMPHDEIAVDMKDYISSLKANLTQARIREGCASHGFQ